MPHRSSALMTTDYNGSVADWLRSIKMDMYTVNFLQFGITTMDYVSRLNLQDLVNMGISLIGHQKKIMHSVQCLRAQLESTQLREGFLV